MDRVRRVATRENLGSWLGGGESPQGQPPAGSRLGLPESGRGSLAPVIRRVAALAVDWLLCLLISTGFFDGNPMATLAVFAVENVLLIGTIGHTLGHRLLGLHVRSAAIVAGGLIASDGAVGARPVSPLPDGARPGGALPDGGPVGLARAALRTVLLCLVIPAVVWDRDGRGLHDRAAGTAVVRL